MDAVAFAYRSSFGIKINAAAHSKRRGEPDVVGTKKENHSAKVRGEMEAALQGAQMVVHSETRRV